MLVVTVEVHPVGDSNRRYKIGEARISNLGLGSVEGCPRYQCAFSDTEQARAGEKPWQYSLVSEHRREEDSFWKLIGRAIAANENVSDFKAAKALLPKVEFDKEDLREATDGWRKE